jgi:hypothetical protein
MAKLVKIKQQLVKSTKGRLRKTLVEDSLANYTKEQALAKGDIFYQSWKGYLENQYSEALVEDGKRTLFDIITKGN